MASNKLLALLKRKPRDNYVEKTPEDVYTNIAEQQPDYTKEDIAKIGGMESEHGKYLENMAGGSPQGLFQFMPRTAEAIRPGSRDSLKDINTQEELMNTYLTRNTNRIKGVQGESSIEDAYAYHNLGPATGKKFMTASDDAPLSSVLSANIIKSNPTLYGYKTVGEAKAAMKKLLQENGDTFNFQPDIQDLLKGEQ